MTREEAYIGGQKLQTYMDEQEKIRLKKQLNDPRKDSKKDSKSSKRNIPVATEICRHFAAGKCTRGVACPYKHVTSKESRVATVP